MELLDSKTFNPEILYVFDPWNYGARRGEEHHHDFLEISFILEGEVVYHVDQKVLTLNAGNLLLFNPGVDHWEEQLSETRSHQLHIGIKNVSLTGLARNVFPNNQAYLQLDRDLAEILSKAWQIIAELNEQKSEHNLMVKSLVTEILVLILRGLEKRQPIQPLMSQTKIRQQKLVNHTVYYLENHYMEEITLEMLAKKLFVSPTFLSKIFKEAMGVSPINYLIKIRLERSKVLLTNEEMSVKEIAGFVGYSDALYFSKLFKKYYGESPTKLGK